MKILKLLSKFYFIFVFSFFFITNLEAEDKPIDIWNIDKTQVEDNNSQLPSNIEIEENENSQNKINIFSMQSEKELNTIELENALNFKNLKIIGLYDPEDYGLPKERYHNPAGAVWESGSDRLLAFSLPSVFKGQTSSSDKSTLSDVPEEIETEESEEVEFLGVQVGVKRKFTEDEEAVYKEWKKREEFRAYNNKKNSKGKELASVEEKLLAQQQTVLTWKRRLEYTETQVCNSYSYIPTRFFFIYLDCLFF